jgi:hypothetical protein
VFATFKILAAMARLGEFTVKELAAAADVPEGTARTVLDRNSDLRKQIGVQATGKPGGQIIRYGLSGEEARRRLSERLAAGYAEIGAVRAAGPAEIAKVPAEEREAASSAEPPPGESAPIVRLEALEEALDRLESKEGDPLSQAERATLLKLAGADYRSALDELRGHEAAWRYAGRLATAKHRLDGATNPPAGPRISPGKVFFSWDNVFIGDPEPAVAPAQAALAALSDSDLEPILALGARIVLVDMTGKGVGGGIATACEQALLTLPGPTIPLPADRMKFLFYDGLQADRGDTSLIAQNIAAEAKDGLPSFVLVVDTSDPVFAKPINDCVQVLSGQANAAVVLDTAYNATMRNYLLSHDVVYEPTFRDLKGDAVTTIVRQQTLAAMRAYWRVG